MPALTREKMVKKVLLYSVIRDLAEIVGNYYDRKTYLEISFFVFLIMIQNFKKTSAKIAYLEISCSVFAIMPYKVKYFCTRKAYL